MMEINSELLRKLLTIVEKKIKEINKSIIASNEEIEKVNEFDDIISRIKDDELCFADAVFNEHLEILVGEVEVSDKKLLNDLLDTIEYLKFVSLSIENNKFTSFSSDELEQKEEVINTLLKFKELSNEQRAEEIKNITKSNRELEQCVALYDKLRKGKEGLVHLNGDLNYLLSLIKDENSGFVRDVLELIRQLTILIHDNVMNQISIDVLKDETEEELEDVQQEVIDEELISELFSKYGFDFNIFTKKHKLILMSRCKLQRIEQVLETLTANPEYFFVKNYQYNKNEKALFLIFRHASKETLTYLVEDARKLNEKLEDIFSVNGVYKKVSITKDVIEPKPGPNPPRPNDDDYLSGSFDYYRRNTEIFNQLSKNYKEKTGNDVDFRHEILLKSPVVFTYNPDLISKNIRHMINYGIDLCTDDGYGLEPNSLSILGSRNFLKLSDILIENNLYQYLVDYPSVIRDEALLKIILFEQRNDNLKMNGKGQIRYIRRERNKYNLAEIDAVINRDNINTLLIGLEMSDEFYTVLDEIENYSRKSLNTLSDQTISRFDSNSDIMKDSVHYIINGVKISRMKFIRVWSAIMISGMNKKYSYPALLFFALTYNSIYSDENLNRIVEFVNQPEFGGVPGNGTRKSI